MSQVVEALIKLDSSCQVTATSVNNLLNNLIKQHNDNQIDMPIILNSFSLISKQLETLWNDVDNERFSLVSPLPLKSIATPFNTPALLCSSIAKDHSGAIVKVDTKYPVLSEEEEEELLNEIDAHNDNIQNVLDAYQARVEEIKKDLKRKQDEKSRDLRLKAKLSKK